MANQPFPVPESTKSFWRTNLHSLDSHRSTDALPQEADIVIIGAGYAGASLAHHLLENDNTRKQSILILEAREACSGATGRNGGHMKPNPFSKPGKLIDTCDERAAEEVAAFEFRHLKAIGDLVKRENVDCDYVLTRATDVCFDESVRDQLKAEVDKSTDAGTSTIDDVFFSDEKTAEGVSGVKHAKGCLSYTAGHLWPYKLITHLLAKAISAGVNLQTHTPVDSVSPKPDADGRWTINTSRGSIKAKSLVFATNGYTSALIPELKGKIVPVRGICSRIVTPDGRRAPLLSNTYILRFNDWEYDYLIPRTDGSIVVGGGRRDYHWDLKSWFGNYDDSELIESAKEYFDGYMQRHFYGWEDSGAYTDKVWTGIMGYTSDGFPIVGAVPGKSGQYICAGFNGHGMPQAFLSAQAVASMIVNDKDVEDTGLPQLFRSTKERFDSKEKHLSLKAFEAGAKKMGLQNGSAGHLD